MPKKARSKAKSIPSQGIVVPCRVLSFSSFLFCTILNISQSSIKQFLSVKISRSYEENLVKSKRRGKKNKVQVKKIAFCGCLQFKEKGSYKVCVVLGKGVAFFWGFWATEKF